MKLNRIKLDIDGVLRDMETPMLKLYNEKFNTQMTAEDIFTYDVSKAFPLLGQNAFRFFFEDHIQETAIQAEAYPGVDNTVRRLKNMGFQIDIVSYQPSFEAQKGTLEWLNRHNIQYDNIVFTSSPSKLIVQDDIIIDDCVKYLDEDPHPFKICIDHAYNRDWKPGNDRRGFRVSSLTTASSLLGILIEGGHVFRKHLDGKIVLV